MPSGRTNNFTQSGRGLGHVAPTISIDFIDFILEFAVWQYGRLS